ncbi:uncharacterized protein LOC112512852 [Cynara cardunculus var. scolymus]|uniref:uncharacterized protein LOC112512852 n=1 Tax=Cynara cardunculus var. scolymus TaxID=59895 RepID=UPI000D629D29|nr:uncharacterized protein LOC112512852 [Cynara cardunculus var. scolymus]
MTKKIDRIRERIKTTQDRQKSYADKSRKPIKFLVGDYVMLKVSLWKGIVRFGKRGKLSPKYIEPFKVSKRVGTVAYQLELQEELDTICNTFRVSYLEKYLADPNMVVPLPAIQIDDKLSFVETPEAVIDRKTKVLRNKEVNLVKVQCRFHKGQEATWELESDMRTKYLQIFV